MKSLNTALVLLTLTFSSVIKAEDIIIPVIQKPAILQEGTQRELSEAQIAELLPWAKDSQLFLTDLLDNIQGLTKQDQIDRLVEGIKTVVGDSASKNSELLMRYSLNRGLVLNKILSSEMDNDAVGTLDAKLRVLLSSINMALKYYSTDMQVISKKTSTPFVLYGLDYFNFLNELNKSIFDASAQYAVQRTALEWLQWDLYRDLENASYAPQIVKINNALKTFPSKATSDSQSIANIRLMKKTAEQLKIQETIKKTKEEKNKIIFQKEIENMRTKGRSDVDLEKMKLWWPQLLSDDTELKGMAMYNLSEVAGADITMRLAAIFIDPEQKHYDITSAFKYLEKRVNKISYVLKDESLNQLNESLLSLFEKQWSESETESHKGWKDFRAVVLVREIGTMRSYQLLSKWRSEETEFHSQRSLDEALEAVEKKLNQ